MDNTIAIVLILLILLVFFCISRNNKSENADNPKVIERVIGEKPTHMPTFTRNSDIDAPIEFQSPGSVIDFTAVPVNITNIEKSVYVNKYGNSKQIVDSKYVNTNKIKPIERTADVIDIPPRVLTVAEKQAYEVMQMQLNLLKDPWNQNADEREQDDKYKKEFEYIKSLPISNDCEDKNPKCEQWALDNRCITQSRMMLNTCPKSCFSCKMNDKQKSNLMSIYGARDLNVCLGGGDAQARHHIL